jgi:hypothetical protein
MLSECIISLLLIDVIIGQSPLYVYTQTPVNDTIAQEAIRSIVNQTIIEHVIIMDLCPTSPYVNPYGSIGEMAVRLDSSYFGNGTNTSAPWTIDRVDIVVLGSGGLPLSNVSAWFIGYTEKYAPHYYVNTDPDTIVFIRNITGSLTVVENTTAVRRRSNTLPETSVITILAPNITVNGQNNIRWLSVRLLTCNNKTRGVGVPWLVMSNSTQKAPFRMAGNPISQLWQAGEDWYSGAYVPTGAFIVIFSHDIKFITPRNHTSPSPSSSPATSKSSVSSAALSTISASSNAIYIAIGCVGGVVVLTTVLAASFVARRWYNEHNNGLKETLPGWTESGMPVTDIGSAAVSLAAIPRQSPSSLGGIEIVRKGALCVSTDGIEAATSKGAVVVELERMVDIIPTHIMVRRDALRVGQRDQPGVATFRVYNKNANYAIQYRIDVSADGMSGIPPPFELGITEILLEGEGTPSESSLALDKEVFNMRGALSPSPVSTGELGPNESTIFAIFILPTASTMRRPIVRVAFGLLNRSKVDKIYKRSKYSSLNATIRPDEIMAGDSPEQKFGTQHPGAEYSVHAFEVFVSVAPHPLIDVAELDVKREVGRGSFGVVSEAVWRGTQTVAVKDVASTDSMGSSDEVRRELNHMAELRNSYIVQFFGFSTTPGHIQIITEFCALGSIDKLIMKDQNMSLALRKRFAQDIARGMAFLVSAGIVHRDLKPGNVLAVHLEAAADTPCCKITDFGSARSRIGGSDTALAGQMTKGVGTPAFMAPEVMDGGKYGQHSDVYAYAVTVYQIFSGHEPYDEFKWGIQVSSFVCGGQRLPLDSLKVNILRLDPTMSELARIVVELITNAWAHDPKQRPDFGKIVLILK